MSKKVHYEKKYGRIAVDITNPDKILIPDDITKLDVIEYYEQIADRMLPLLKNHALMMLRYPEGIYGESFYQKDASDYFPDWIKRAQIPKTGGYNNFVVCQNKATLVYLANQACLTPHLWLSRIDALHYPDRLIFDLDPSHEKMTPQLFSDIRAMALLLHEMLTLLGLVSFVMTSGSRGLHVYVPLDRKATFEESRAFATYCARIMIDEHPDKVTLELRKDKREGKIFIDTLRNQYGATSVAPYAIRAKPHGPVATPLHWQEVHDKTLMPTTYTMSNIFDRFLKIEDPWKDILKIKQSLKKPLSKIKKMEF